MTLKSHVDTRCRVFIGFSMAVLVMMLSRPEIASAQHDADMWIGQKEGRVAWHPVGLQPESVYHPLGPVDTFIQGWSDNDPGFDHVVTTVDGVTPLPPVVQVALEIVEVDPAFVVIDNSFQLLTEPGDRTVLGGSNLHEHITWFVDEEDPLFDETKCVWETTFNFVDLTGNLDDSGAFTLLFANVPVRGGVFPPADIPANGDFDTDGTVDLTDFQAFAHCYAGPDVRPMPDDPAITDCEVECHNAFDFDDDLDVDLLDFADLQVQFGGSE